MFYAKYANDSAYFRCFKVGLKMYILIHLFDIFCTTYTYISCQLYVYIDIVSKGEGFLYFF